MLVDKHEKLLMAEFIGRAAPEACHGRRDRFACSPAVAVHHAAWDDKMPDHNNTNIEISCILLCEFQEKLFSPASSLPPSTDCSPSRYADSTAAVL